MVLLALLRLTLLLFKIKTSSSAINNNAYLGPYFPPEEVTFDFDSKSPEEITDLVDKSQNFFKSSTQFIGNASILSFKLMTGYEPIFNASGNQYPTRNPFPSLPKFFNSGARWLKCSVLIMKVPGWRNFTCSLGWALSFAKTVTDRLCIASNGKIQMEVSVPDLLRCCKSCLKAPRKPVKTSNSLTNLTTSKPEALRNNSSTVMATQPTTHPSGTHKNEPSRITPALATEPPIILDYCWGGDAKEAWNYWLKHDVVSGGYTKDSKEGCLSLTPSSLFPSKSPNSSNTSGFNVCGRGCSVKHKYEEARYQTEVRKYKLDAKIVTPQNVKEIQAEIMQNGPVQAGIDVYEDFLTYKTGVYKHVIGRHIGFHSVVIVGWGVVNNTDYWKVTNVWGKKFGQRGHILILRGQNECNIEKFVIAVQIKRLLKKPHQIKLFKAGQSKNVAIFAGASVIVPSKIMIVLSSIVAIFLLLG